MSKTTDHACIVQLHGLIREVVNPLGLLRGMRPRLQQAWLCPECGKTTWRDVESVTEEEAANE